MTLVTPEHLREISRLTAGNRDIYRNACRDAADEIERLHGIEAAAKTAADIYEARIELLEAQVEAERSRAIYLSRRAGEAEARIEQLEADKDVQRSQARNASYEASIAELEARIERLKAALRLAEPFVEHMAGWAARGSYEAREALRAALAGKEGT